VEATVSRQDEIKMLKAGESPPSHRVVQLRAMGMQSIRFQFVVHLLRSGLDVDTLSIYWEQGNEFKLKGVLENARRRLVLGRNNRVSGEFADLWLLCYPEDEGIKKLVEEEVDRMVERMRGKKVSD
jgi:hypothetical protein